MQSQGQGPSAGQAPQKYYFQGQRPGSGQRQHNEPRAPQVQAAGAKAHHFDHVVEDLQMYEAKDDYGYGENFLEHQDFYLAVGYESYGYEEMENYHYEGTNDYNYDDGAGEGWY